MHGIEQESVSWGAVSETNSDNTTDDGSGGKESDGNDGGSSDENNEIEWWLLIVTLILSFGSLIFVTVYYQKRVNKLQQRPSDYQIMS